VFGEHCRTIAGYFKCTAGTLDEFDLDPGYAIFKFFSQTGCTGIVVSDHAVFDSYFHNFTLKIFRHKGTQAQRHKVNDVLDFMFFPIALLKNIFLKN